MGASLEEASTWDDSNGDSNQADDDHQVDVELDARPKLGTQAGGTKRIAQELRAKAYYGCQRS